MILDTSIFIDYFRGDERAAVTVVRARREGAVVMHAVVAAELLSGVLGRAELKRTTSLISTCRLLVPDESDVRRALRLLERHVLAHGVGWNDCLIAATALRLDSPVVTLNTKHFQIMRGLDVIRPY